MSRRCFFRCDNKTTLYALPKADEIKNQWLEFMFHAIPAQYSQKLTLCSRHFLSDCFVNLHEFEAGFVQRLILKDGSVPTLFGFQASTSKPLITVRSSYDVECQTDPIPAVSVGIQHKETLKSVSTQLSWGTLRECHKRSKGTQTGSSSLNVFTKTPSTYPNFRFSISSTPFKPTDFNPRKRPRLELKEEETECEIPCESNDFTYKSEDPFVTEESELPHVQRSSHGERKYIVFESCLRDLFDICPLCQKKCDVHQQQAGTFVSFNQLCPNCKYNKQWNSQPIVGSTPTGNLLLSAATYFTGTSFTQIEKVFQAMHLQAFQNDTFKKHTRNFLEPAIVHKWKTDQADMLMELQRKDKIAVAGDMIADGPSARYGSHVLLNLDTNTIIDLQLVQSNEVQGSYYMKKEGLKRSLDFLDSNGLTVDYIVTDRHPQIQTFLKDRSITQYYDVWNFEKGLSKKLHLLAQKKDCGVLKKWMPSIKDHIYWSATSSSSGPEKVAKWTSLINHLQNVHVHDDPIFPKCEHTDQESNDSKKWLLPGSVVLHQVEKILVDERVLRDVAKLSPHHQTSFVEPLQRLILRFAPKNVTFPFIRMLCRLYLATMHYNENADCEQSVTSAGKARSGESTERPIKTEPTYRYVDDLISLVLDEVSEDPVPYVEQLKEIPIPMDLASRIERPVKEEVIEHDISPFVEVVVGTQHDDQAAYQRDDSPDYQHDEPPDYHRDDSPDYQHDDQLDQETPSISGEQYATG
nr:uncharacterized protein LOC129438558 isoform X1 [Misgurnus anguillicaudatus]